jgi:importin subunit beta-1
VSYEYAAYFLDDLIPMLTKTLTKQEEDPENDDWIPAKAASVCINLLAQCCHNAIIKPTLPFIHANLSNKNWHYREAAVTAFGSILDGPNPEILLHSVEQAIDPLIRLVSDPHVSLGFFKPSLISLTLVGRS